MANKEIYELDAVAAANDFAAADGGSPEGQTRKSVNDSRRENMATMRRWYDDQEWIVVRIQGPLAGDIGVFSRVSATQFTISLSGVDLSGYFTDGRIIKIVDGVSSGVDLITQVNGNATYSDPLTTVNIKATDSMVAGSTDAQTYISSIARGLSLRDVETDFYIPTTADDEGLQAACDAAAAAPGGTVLMIHQVYAINAKISIPDGSIRLLGALPNTIIQADAASDLSSLVELNDASEAVVFENIIFKAEHSTQSSGNNYGVEILAASKPQFKNCVFDDCRIAIHLNASSTDDIGIDGCKFVDYKLHAIAGTGPTNTHSGHITDCRFDGAGVDETDPAAIKLSGEWSISGCTFENMGHASLAARAIWMENKTGTRNGAYQSRAVGNRIDGSNAANFTGIEVGADYCTASGNVIRCATSTGTGIHLISRTGGQNAEGLSITGNSIEGGALGISANDLTRKSTISGNSVLLGVAGSCIELAGGSNTTVSANTLRGGNKGVLVSGAASENFISGNAITGAVTTAVEVADTASDTYIVDNEFESVPLAVTIEENCIRTSVRNNHLGAAVVNLSNLSATTLARGNDTQVRNYTNQEFVYVDAVVAETIIPAFQDVAAPGEVGSGKFRVWWNIDNDAAFSRGCEIKIYHGRNHDTTDTLMDTFSILSSSATDTVGYALDPNKEYTLTDAVGTLTMTARDTGGAGQGVRITVNHFYLERILDE